MKVLARILNVILPVTAIVLVVFQVVVSNELATLGKRLSELDAEVRVVSDLNEELRTEVASASSLLTLRARAQLLGFVEPTTKQIMNLTSDVPVALR